MIGKGKSISHTRASIGYGWNQEKNAEIILSQHLAGENPKEITEEFKIIQSQNKRCEKNTLSFVLSPAIEDGQKLSNKELKELTRKFLQKMELKERQAIAFVHRDKQHTHIHLYVNRIGFDAKAYKDNFIGKRSQQKAYEVAKEMGLTNARDIQNERLGKIKEIRQEIKHIHETVMKKERPRDVDQYIRYMKQRDIKVIPTVNRSNKLQGFRFVYKGHNLKGSEVHRSMSGGKLAIQIAGNSEKGIVLKKNGTISLLGKTTELASNLAAGLAKRAIKKTIKKVIDLGMGI